VTLRLLRLGSTLAASAAFVERLQSSLSFARKCLIAALEQRQKAFADQRHIERTFKVGDKVLLSIAKSLASFLPSGLVHLKSCRWWEL
jgi:hypothetical protein